VHASAAPLPAALLAALLCAAPAAAQHIQDNSFLLEEAYNQEEGVVQHIGTFERPDPGGGWVFALTEEWPIFDRRHQFSFTIPLVSAEGAAAGFGDLSVDYRYQLLGDGDARVAAAPRLSLLLATGDETEGRGEGRIGAEIGVPASVVLAPALVAHTNAALAFLLEARQGTGPRDRSLQSTLGQSLVWLAHPRVNVLLEAVWKRREGESSVDDLESLFISPGVRAGFDVGSVQVVPGIAIPIGAGPSSGERSLLVYLSLEHGFVR